jgi:hypothetical protein
MKRNYSDSTAKMVPDNVEFIRLGMGDIGST